jgi:CheY-like chemotaxis protein
MKSDCHNLVEGRAVGDSLKKSRSNCSVRSLGESNQLPIDQKTVQENKEFQSKTVLLVDDDVDTRLLTKMFLNNFGYEVDSVDSAGEALARFDPDLHDVVVTDNSMKGMTGGEMSHIIKLRSPSTPVLMCTGNPPSDRSSIDIVITKPTHLLAIKDALDKLLPPK